MVNRKTWEEFKATGLLWWINMILHTFGWAIVVSFDDAGNVKEAYPARVRYRGFDEKTNSVGYHHVAEFMANNGADILFDDENMEEIKL